MKTELVTAPAAMPVTSDELRTHLWTIYPEKTTDDYLDALISAATSYVETATWRKLISQKWRLYLDAWPSDGIRLPFGSVLSIDKVTWLDEDAAETDLSATTDYIASLVGSEPIIIPRSDGWPSDALFDIDAIRVEFTAGYGAAATAIPPDLCQAIQMLASHWYENREAVIVGTTVRKVPFAVDALIQPYRVWYS